jgi:hypothetical protein
MVIAARGSFARHSVGVVGCNAMAADRPKSRHGVTCGESS